MPPRESSAAETLDDGQSADRRTGPGRRLALIAVVALLALAAVAVALRLAQSDDSDPVADPGLNQPVVSAVRAEVVADSGDDTLVTLRFADLPRDRTILDITGLPEGVGYDGPPVIPIPDDGDIDVEFRWEDVDCGGRPPGYVALTLRLGRPGEDVAATSVLVDAADAFDYAWQEACRQTGSAATRR